MNGWWLVNFAGFLSHISNVECGQTCLSCSAVESLNNCQHHTTCSNDETCNHMTGSIFGRRSEGHHLLCTSCCNNTKLCNDNPVCSITKPIQCSEITAPNAQSGVYTIYPGGKTRPVPVYCHISNGVKWTVIQRRLNGCTDFYLGWQAYTEGFGNVSSEYWIGNDNIHEITSHGHHKLRVELSDFDDNSRYAEYSTFYTGDEVEAYQLVATGYSGNAGDSLSYHSGMMFSTFDRDNDLNTTGSIHRGVVVWQLLPLKLERKIPRWIS